MKKILLSSVLLSLLGLSIVGCSGNNPQPDEKPLAITECIIGQEEAPNWSCGIVTGYEDMFTATGTSNISKAGDGFSRKNAMADGRSNLAQQIETLVKDKIERFARSTGIGSNETVDTTTTQVSKQVAKVTLKGSKQLAYWQHPVNSDIYVLMGVSKESVNTSTNASVHTSFKNKNALWQQFQAEQALHRLEVDTK